MSKIYSNEQQYVISEYGLRRFGMEWNKLIIWQTIYFLQKNPEIARFLVLNAAFVNDMRIWLRH